MAPPWSVANLRGAFVEVLRSHGERTGGYSIEKPARQN